MLNFLTVSTLPMWAKVVMIIGGIILGVNGIIGLLRRVIPGFRRRLIGYGVFHTAFTVLALLAAYWLLWTGITAQAMTADTPQVDDVPTVTEPPKEELPDEAFYVNLSDEDLLVWLKGIMGDDFDVYKDVRCGYRDTSMPSHTSARTEASRTALRTYFGKDSYEGFNDAVAMPLMKLIEEMKTGEWQKFTADEKAIWINANIKRDLYLEDMTNPVVTDMWVNWLLEMAQEFPEITERSPWLVSFKADLDTWHGRTSAPVGWQNIFEKKKSITDPNVFTSEYTMNCIRVVYLLDTFDWASDPVQALKSTVNWRLPISGDANLTRTAKASEQEDLPALLLQYRYKSGTLAMLGGINIFDSRAEKFSVKEPAKPSNPEPIVTTTPSEYTLTIKYVYADGSKAADTYTAKLKEGAAYNRTSPEIKGYTCDKPVVKGTMPANDLTIKVTYTKPADNTPKTYTLLIKYQYADGSKAADDYSAKLKEGESYNRTSPEIKGYTPNIPVVSGTMPDHDLPIQVTYYKNADPTYRLTINYVYASGAKAWDSYVANLKKGEAYRVESRPIDGYDCDKPVVSGTMPAENRTITVTYTRKAVASHKLTIYYKFNNGSMAAPTYEGTYKEGQAFSIMSPVIAKWVSDKQYVSGTMGTQDLYYTVWYNPLPPDGEGGKDKDDSNGNKNPEHPGDDLNPDDGTSDYQPYEPPVIDTPTQDQVGGAPTSGGNTPDTSAGSDYRQEVSDTPVTPSEDTNPNQSSGLGGQDHPVQDANGGNTDGGTPPEKEEIPVNNDTVITDNNPDGSQTSTPATDDGVQTGTILPPD